MILVNGYLINDKFIKTAVMVPLKLSDEILNGYPEFVLKIVFIDNTEMTYRGIDPNAIYNEINKKLKEE